MKKVFLNNKHWIILMSLVILLIAAITIGHKFYLEQSAKNAIISFGKTIQTTQIEKAHQSFCSNALFVYGSTKNTEISYIEALNNLKIKMQTDSVKGDIYVGEIQNITTNVTTITFVSWFSIDGENYEASGTAELLRKAFGKWKINRIESDMWAFGKIFFAMEVPQYDFGDTDDAGAIPMME